MALADALAAVRVFPNTTVRTSAGSLPLRQVMVAIAGAETGGTWNPAAKGDKGLPAPQCNGYTSFGLWQIHTVHQAYLKAATGSSNPCVWSKWLSNPANNASAALAVYNSQGLSAWTTYTGGEWLRYLSYGGSSAQPTEVSTRLAASALPTGSVVTPQGVLGVGIGGTGLTVSDVVVGAIALKLLSVGLAAL